jgi:Rho-binding antiterminator
MAGANRNDGCDVRESMTDYQPISCINHDRLEYAVLTRRKLELTWQAPDETAQRKVLLPLDVWTQDGAEWLKAGDEQGGQQLIRLDWISVFCELE